MEIIAHGIDLVDFPRLEQLIERHGDRFLNRVFTPAEQAYARAKRNSLETYAGRFAAKEAVLKAIGTGLSGGIRWTDVEVVNEPGGKPAVRLGGRITRRIGEKKVLLTISHTKELAIAQAILLEG